MKTLILGKNDIDTAAELISRGELVAVPTETVYGLACNGLDEKAVEKVYEVKGRPEIKPLSLMLHKSAEPEKYCTDIPKQAKTLMDKFWPGPLTIVLKSRDNVPEIVRAGGKTVALRCPDHGLTQLMLEKSRLPFAAPSANPSGAKSPVTAQEVLEYFDGKIAAVADGGKCGVGVESTIVDMSAVPYRILRHGALSSRDISSALAEKLRVIGITGGTGCGKTTALRELESMGALIIDCDSVYHELLESSSELISDILGQFPAAASGDGLDRKALGRIVFSDEAALEKLNGITHRHICLKVRQMLEDWALCGGEIAAIDAIALIESGLAESCCAVVGIVADTKTRISRIMARDGISCEYAEMRVQAQKPNDFFENNCSYVLHNDGSHAEFKEKCKNLFKEVLKNE